MTTRFELMPYRAEHRDAVDAITRTSWSGVSMDELLEKRHGVVGGTPWQEHKIASVLAFCDAHPDAVIVAEVDGRAVGYATFSIDAPNRVGHVLNNAVEPAYRGRGIGSAMHRSILERFRKASLAFARVSTLEQDEAAKHMYERNGFREIARTIHFTLDLS